MVAGRQGDSSSRVTPRPRRPRGLARPSSQGALSRLRGWSTPASPNRATVAGLEDCTRDGRARAGEEPRSTVDTGDSPGFGTRRRTTRPEPDPGVRSTELATPCVVRLAEAVRTPAISDLDGAVRGGAIPGPARVRCTVPDTRASATSAAVAIEAVDLSTSPVDAVGATAAGDGMDAVEAVAAVDAKRNPGASATAVDAIEVGHSPGPPGPGFSTGPLERSTPMGSGVGAGDDRLNDLEGPIAGTARDPVPGALGCELLRKGPVAPEDLPLRARATTPSPPAPWLDTDGADLHCSP